MRINLIFFSLLLLGSRVAYAQQDTLTDQHTNFKNIAVFTDSTAAIPAAAILSSGTFTTVSSTVINAGVSPSPTWLRLVIQTDRAGGANSVLELSNPNLDEVTLYHMVNGQVADSVYSTEKAPISERRIQDQNYIFDMSTLAQNATDTFLVRITSSEQMLFPINLSTVEKIEDNNHYRDLINGIYYGIMLVMFFYNLFIFFTVKDKDYLFYIFYILFVTLTQLTLQGFGYRYFWSGLPYFTKLSVHFNGAMSGLTTILFVQHFLKTKQLLKKLNYVLTVILVCDVIAIILAFSNQLHTSYKIVDLNAGLGCFFVLGLAIYISIKGSRPAKFFLVGWGVFLASVIIFVLRDFQVVPYNNFTRYVLLIGSAFEVTFLSFALADKINIYKKEKEISQAEALKAAQENERIIREQNVMLEQKVTERTYELETTNDNLSQALVDLKQTQSQLVDQEKMASLGQLTAGIAHEINNPINFVTSNVKPLKRDVEMLIDLMNNIEAVGAQNDSAEEKKAAVAKLKKDFDYDYLLEEINFLLKGINEGSSRTAEIVKGLRLFSRVDEDDIKMADINEGIDSTLIIINNVLNGKIAIIKEYGDLPQIECYPGKLNQVFLNIVTNAAYAVKAKYKDEKGGEITIRTYTEGPYLNIVFADNGSGMDEGTKKKLFEPFFTTKPVGEGTGLGLSIAFNTIKKHNGLITVKSELNSGTEFTIKIPIEQPK